MIDTSQLVQAFLPYRGDAIVVPGRASRHWQEISDKPGRDVPLGDPAMGGHASFAFGLALAQPDVRVVLFDSEGDLLMNLGALPTIAEKAPRNFYHFVMDNECYATTGGQPVPNARGIRYDLIAKGAGYPSAYSMDNLEDFASSVGRILEEPGPVLVALKIVPEVENLPIGERVRWQTRTLEEILGSLQQELGVSPRAPHGRNMRVVRD